MIHIFQIRFQCLHTINFLSKEVQPNLNYVIQKTLIEYELYLLSFSLIQCNRLWIIMMIRLTMESSIFLPFFQLMENISNRVFYNSMMFMKCYLSINNEKVVSFELLVWDNYFNKNDFFFIIILCHILIIDTNQSYVQIVNKTLLFTFVEKFLLSISKINYVEY